MTWSLRFQGVGNASSVELGSAMATIEHHGQPWLTIDCGAEGLTAYIQQYGTTPDALFITHVHLDHVAGFERLFVDHFFDQNKPQKPKIYVPATVVPLLHQRVGNYPNVLAEGGANFWDAFQLIPVTDTFWHEGMQLQVFPVRHHWPETAYGLRLPGSLVWSGDTRPIPEMLNKFADQNEVIAHDCSVQGNPSHSGIDDLEREYSAEILKRCVLYHYNHARDGKLLRDRGYHVADANDVVQLADPLHTLIPTAS